MRYLHGGFMTENLSLAGFKRLSFSEINTLLLTVIIFAIDIGSPVRMQVNYREQKIEYKTNRYRKENIDILFPYSYQFVFRIPGCYTGTRCPWTPPRIHHSRRHVTPF